VGESDWAAGIEKEVEEFSDEEAVGDHQDGVVWSGGGVFDPLGGCVDPAEAVGEGFGFDGFDCLVVSVGEEVGEAVGHGGGLGVPGGAGVGFSFLPAGFGDFGPYFGALMRCFEIGGDGFEGALERADEDFVEVPRCQAAGKSRSLSVALRGEGVVGEDGVVAVGVSFGLGVSDDEQVHGSPDPGWALLFVVMVGSPLRDGVDDTAIRAGDSMVVVGMERGFRAACGG